MALFVVFLCWLCCSFAQTTVYDFTQGSIPFGVSLFCGPSFPSCNTAIPAQWSFTPAGVTLTTQGNGFSLNSFSFLTQPNFAFDLVLSYPTFVNGGGNNLATIVSAPGSGGMAGIWFNPPGSPLGGVNGGLYRQQFGSPDNVAAGVSAPGMGTNVPLHVTVSYCQAASADGFRFSINGQSTQTFATSGVPPTFVSASLFANGNGNANPSPAGTTIRYFRVFENTCLTPADVQNLAPFVSAGQE